KRAPVGGRVGWVSFWKNSELRTALVEGAGAEAQAVEADEAGGVVLVIPALHAFHRRDVLVVEGELGFATDGDDVALVELETDGAGDALLGLVNEGLQGLALGGEPEAVVNELGVFRDERVAQVLDLAVEGEGFELLVRLHEDGAARGLIDAAALHADEAVFNDVNAADAVLAAELVEGLEDLAGGELLAVDGHAVALDEVELDILGLVRRVLGGDGKLEHGLVVLGGRVEPGILEDAGLVGDVEKVAVHRVGL